jgi:hypothetical protein
MVLIQALSYPLLKQGVWLNTALSLLVPPSGMPLPETIPNSNYFSCEELLKLNNEPGDAWKCLGKGQSLLLI